MAETAPKTEALAWVLAKLAAKAPVFHPPALKPVPQPSFTPVSNTPKNPLKTEAEKQQELATTRKKEELLWHEWVKGGKKPEHFVPLWKSHLRLINNAVAKFKGVEISPAALRGHATDLYWDALDSWNPSMKGGAALSSHIFNNLRGLKRYVVKYQNTAKITEPLAEKITPFRTAKALLTERLERDPALHEIVEATHAKDWKGKKLSMRDALEVSRYVRRAFDLSGGGDSVEGAGVHHNDPDLQIAHLIYHSLKPDERKVHELLFPRDGGKELTASGDIAKKLGWHVSKVSKAKNVILKKIAERRPY